MKEILISMELQRVELLSQLKAFNEKAKILGIEPISLDEGGDDVEMSEVYGKRFPHISDAQDYLESIGFKKLSTKCYSKGVVVVHIYDDCSDPAGWSWRLTK